MALKMQREVEMKVHEEFYNNVHLLTLSCPPVESFTLVFKKDMFVKTNKVGFQQVTYYLLEVLNKDVLKQKVPTWPLYDVRSENEFRNEVMKYINELNTIYEDANIPNIATSHLISPGGFKFIKFMFKLSQFVLYQHLKRNQICRNMLLPLQPSKKDAVTKENIEKLEIATCNINLTTNNIRMNFESKFGSAKLDSENIMRKLCTITDLNDEYKTKLRSLKEKLLKDKDNSELCCQSRKEIENNCKRLESLKEKTDRVKLLSSYLEKPLKLTYNCEFSQVPDPIRRIQIENDMLDLNNLIESCITFADRKRLEIKPMSQENLKKELERFNILNQKLKSMLEDLNCVHSTSLNLSERLKNESLQTLSLQDKPSNLKSNLGSPLTITP